MRKGRNHGRFTLIELLACQGVARRAKRSKAFTLIELLVCVTIIAILAALLLPTLGRAKRQARRTVELAGRKQVMMATMMYAEDNSGHLMDRGLPSRAPHSMRYGSRPNLNIIFTEPYIGEGAEIRAEFMFCQSDLLKVRDPWGKESASYGPNHTAGTYNYMTLVFFNMPLPDAGSWQVPWFSIQTVDKAAPNRPAWSCPGFRKTNGIWFAHDQPLVYSVPEGGNVVYMDGSGRWVKQRERVPWHNWYGQWYMPEDGL